MPTDEKKTAPPPKRVKYINPGKIPTRVTDQYGLTTMLEPWENRRVGAYRNSRTFIVELEPKFGDILARTGQITRAPKDLQDEEPMDEAHRAFHDARMKAIEEQRARRAQLQALQDADIQVGDSYERALQRMNSDVDEDAPELDTEHAAPVVPEVSRGTENLTSPVDAQGNPVKDPIAEVGGAGMSRKKRPKDH